MSVETFTFGVLGLFVAVAAINYLTGGRRLLRLSDLKNWVAYKR